MSLASMIFSPLIKKLESDPKLIALAQKVKDVDTLLSPIFAAEDQTAIASAISTISGGKITPSEAQIVETEIGVILNDIEAAAGDIKADVK